MASRGVLGPAAFGLKAVQLLGLLAMLASVPIGVEDGPLPADRLARRKSPARTALFAGGGSAALASLGRHAVDRPRPKPLSRKGADDRDA